MIKYGIRVELLFKWRLVIFYQEVLGNISYSKPKDLIKSQLILVTTMKIFSFKVNKEYF